MVKYLKNEFGFECLSATINRSKTIDVTEYSKLGDADVVSGAYSFDVRRIDKSKFRNCETAEEWFELKEKYGFNFIRHRNY